jgi:hypothetical protein
MAAQPNFWGTMVSREGTTSGRMRVRGETNSPDWQRYRQSPLFEKQRANPSAELFPEGLVESRLNHVAAISEEPRDVAEVVEADPLPRIRVAIDKLMSPGEDDGDPAATEHAYQTARAVVESAYGLLFDGKEQRAKQLPIPTVTTDERGGVRLSWQRGDKYVRTSFAAAQGLRSYLYFESPIEHDVEALQPYTLSTRLDWILKA